MKLLQVQYNALENRKLNVIYTPPPLIYLFGLAGSGKSFAGKLLAREFDYYLYEADTDLTQEMKSAIARKQIFTDKMRDDFFEIVVDKIKTLSDQHDKLLVTQATYKQRHRYFILSKFPQIEFIHIDCPDYLIRERLLIRNQKSQLLDLKYVDQISQDFEPPPSNWKVLKNDNNAQRILSQFQQFYL